MKILFVCRGNVGRSQMAEALYKKYGNKNNQVSSAGTRSSNEGQAIKEIPLAFNVIDVMKEEGIDVSEAISNQVTQEVAEAADRIVLVVDDNDPIPDYFTGNQKVVRWNVVDPKGTDLETHRKTREQIKELILTTPF